MRRPSTPQAALSRKSLSFVQMETVLQVVPDAITVQDRSGRVIFANAEGVRVLGYPSLKALLKAGLGDIMRRFRAFTDQGSPFPPEQFPGRRALAGEERPEAVLRYRRIDEGEDHWAHVSARPIRNAEGEIESAVNLFRDITHRHRVEEGQRFLAEASKELSSSLDYERTLRTIARLAVPHFADWCAVDVIGDDGMPHRLAVTHVDPDKIRFAHEVQRQYPPDMRVNSGIAKVARTGLPEIYREITDELLVKAARDPGHLELLRRLGLKSAMLIPLISRGGLEGVISFVTAESRHRYDATDLALAMELAARAGLAIENARLYSREREVDETMQRALLPDTLPSIPGVVLHASYLPGSPDSQVGGDWYDAFRLPDGRMAISIGDVTGRGLDAAVAMGQVRQMIRATAIENPLPTTVLMRAGHGLLHAIESDIIATALFGVLDPVSMDFTYSTAGHPPPALATPEGHVKLLEGGGLPLGVQAPRPSPVTTVTLAPGSLLVLYTDGIIEPKRDVAMGLSTLLETVRAERATPSTNPAQGILSKSLGSIPASDDAAVLTISTDAESLKGFTLTIPSIPSSQPLVRQALRMLAHRVGIPPQRTDALLVALGEAVTNAIEHAYGTSVGLIYVRGSYDRNELTVEVEDRGQWRASRQGPPGYGLVLMRALVDEVDIEREPNRTIIRLRATLPEVSHPSTGEIER